MVLGIGAALWGLGASSRQQNSNARRAAEAQTEAAQNAAQLELQGTRDAIAALERQFQDTVRLQLPRAQAGDTALASMMQMIGLDIPDTLLSGDAYEQILYRPTTEEARQQEAQQEQNSLASYVQSNPDLQRSFDGLSADDQGTIANAGYDTNGDGRVSIDEFGQYHFDTYGQAEGRQLPSGNPLASTAGLGRDLRLPTTAPQGANSLADGPDLSIDAPRQTDITQTPGYQFRFGEGVRAIDSGAAAGGRIMSGAAIRRLNDFGQGLAGEEWNNQYNRLAAIAGVGQTASQTITGANQQIGSQAAGLTTQGANALASGALNVGNARASSYLNRTSTLGNVAGTVAGIGVGVGTQFVGA